MDGGILQSLIESVAEWEGTREEFLLTSRRRRRCRFIEVFFFKITPF